MYGWRNWAVARSFAEKELDFRSGELAATGNFERYLAVELSIKRAPDGAESPFADSLQ